MEKIVIFLIIGFLAQLVDGSLGMAYGVTSTTFFLYIGITPLVASVTIHLAEIFTTAASGIAHLKFENINRRIFFQLTIPGSIGAFVGSLFLSQLVGDLITPYIALFLCCLGIYLFIRFLFFYEVTHDDENFQLSKKRTVPLGFVAGFVDSIGGGGWGPIATPILLAQKGLSARKVIGTVNASEVVIACSASLGFFLSLGTEMINWLLLIPFIVGGVVAAPLAAWLVRFLPEQLMGVSIGGLIAFLNVKTVMLIFLLKASCRRGFMWRCFLSGFARLPVF